MEDSTEAEFLNYHHLRYFRAVAKEGSLRGAAEKLRVSQPSICSQIQQLEAALGEDLFRPSGRSMALTEFGQLIFGYADEIFSLGGEILRAAKQAPTARAIRLNAGVTGCFHLLEPNFLGIGNPLSANESAAALWQVERSADLHNWTPVMSGSASYLRFSDNAGSQARRFYRARKLP